jgi:hypothetical protein
MRRERAEMPMIPALLRQGTGLRAFRQWRDVGCRKPPAALSWCGAAARGLASAPALRLQPRPLPSQAPMSAMVRGDLELAQAG